MGTSRTNPNYIKIPGLYIGAHPEERADATPADLPAQCNKLTVAEQSFLDNQAR